MRRAPLLILLAACGGGGSPWDDGVDDFVAATCVEYADCTGDDPATCESDVRADLGDAEAELDDAGEAACLECLATKAEVVRSIAEDCQPMAEDIAAIVAACDTDPTVDFDGDGTPDNDDDEACAGFP